MKRKIVTKLMAIVLAGVLLTGSVTPGFHMSRVQAAEDLFNRRLVLWRRLGISI